MGSDFILAWVAWATSFFLWIVLFWCAARTKGGAIFSAVVGVFISLIARPPIVLLGLDYPIPWGWFSGYEYETFALGSFVASCWIAIMLITYLFSLHVGVPGVGLLPKERVTPTAGILLFWGALLISISTGVTLVFVVKAGGIAGFQFAVKVSKDFAGSYVVRHIGTLGIILTMVALMAYGKINIDLPRRHKKSFLFFVSGIFLFLGLFTNFLWGNRYYIALILIGCVFSWHYYVKKLSITKVLTFSIASVSCLQGLRTLRFYLFSETVGRDVMSELPFWQEISLSLHLQEFDAMLLAIRDVGDRFDFRMGADFVNGLLSWVPRFLYPDKETFHIGGWLRQVYEPTTVNGWPPALPGAWYINFGSLGIFLGAVISVWVLAVFDAHYRTASSAWSAVMGIMLPLLMASGGISTGFPQQVFMTVFPLWVLCILVQKTPRVAISSKDARSRAIWRV